MQYLWKSPSQQSQTGPQQPSSVLTWKFLPAAGPCGAIPESYSEKYTNWISNLPFKAGVIGSISVRSHISNIRYSDVADFPSEVRQWNAWHVNTSYVDYGLGRIFLHLGVVRAETVKKVQLSQLRDKKEWIARIFSYDTDILFNTGLQTHDIDIIPP